MVLTVAVLGAVEARRDGDRLSVPAGKTTELLVRLALDAGSRVRVDILLEDLWPTSAGRNTLQSKVSQLAAPSATRTSSSARTTATDSSSNRAASTPSTWSTSPRRRPQRGTRVTRRRPWRRPAKAFSCSATAALDGAEALGILDPHRGLSGLVRRPGDARRHRAGGASLRRRHRRPLRGCAGVDGAWLPRAGGAPPGVAGPRAAASGTPAGRGGLVRPDPRCRNGQRRRPDGGNCPAEPRPAARGAPATEPRPFPC